MEAIPRPYIENPIRMEVSPNKITLIFLIFICILCKICALEVESQSAYFD